MVFRTFAVTLTASIFFVCAYITDHNPLGKYFNIELKSIVAQYENLAAKGIFGVRVPQRFFFSFRLTKITRAIFLQINSSINSEDFDIKFIIITPSESILIYS